MGSAFRFLATATLGSTVVMALILMATAVPADARFSTSRAAEIYTGLVADTAVGGYDPVAYFTAGKAIPGSVDITLQHDGVMWRFASESNRDAFAADPARYAPQFGGYCAFAIAQGSIAKGDPEAWSIVDGKLYLNYDARIKATWLKDAKNLIAKGEKNWPAALERS